MKKLICIICAVVLFASCLAVGVSANGSYTFSEDFKTLYLYGDIYHSFDASSVYLTTYFTEEVKLSPSQERLVKEVTLTLDEESVMAEAEIRYKDGSVFTVYYLRSDYTVWFDSLSGSTAKEYLIDFEFPQGNTVTADTRFLFGEETVLYESDLYNCNYYNVTAVSDDGFLTVCRGALIIANDSYYYVDFDEAGVTTPTSFSPYQYSTLTVHVIEDPSLLSDISAAEETFYNYDMGFVYNDDLAELITAIFSITMFALIPGVIMIFSIIMAIISKKSTYKKLYALAVTVASAEIVSFMVAALIIVIYNFFAK